MKPILDGESHEEYRKANRKKGKSTEEQEQEILYNMRCKVVSLSHNYSMMVDYIRKNTGLLSQFDATAKESMRRLCQESLERYARFYSQDDVRLFDSVFGAYIPANKSHTIYEDVPIHNVRDDTPRTLDEQVVTYTNTAYQTFYEWIADPIIQAQLKERPDLICKVQNAIDMNRLHNFVPVYNRGYREYQPEDEALFSEVLESMRECA
jgi:hypothetical protein